HPWSYARHGPLALGPSSHRTKTFDIHDSRHDVVVRFCQLVQRPNDQLSIGLAQVASHYFVAFPAIDVPRPDRALACVIFVHSPSPFILTEASYPSGDTAQSAMFSWTQWSMS